MSIDEQVRFIEGQLKNFDTLLGKMGYMNFAFDNDPEYTQEARDIVRSNISNELKKAEELNESR